MADKETLQENKNSNEKVSYYEFDKDALVENINKARKKKGSHETYTLQEFADRINAAYKNKNSTKSISVATLSRILSKNIKRSLSADLIDAICDAAEDIEDPVAFKDALLVSNGSERKGGKEGNAVVPVSSEDGEGTAQNAPRKVRGSFGARSADSKYVQRYLFNKKELIDNINQARRINRGPDRYTLEEFTAKINEAYAKKNSENRISVATLSRILSGNIKRNLSEDLIEAICGAMDGYQLKEGVDPERSLDFYIDFRDQLYNSNGFVRADSYREKRFQDGEEVYKYNNVNSAFANYAFDVFKIEKPDYVDKKGKFVNLELPFGAYGRSALVVPGEFTQKIWSLDLVRQYDLDDVEESIRVINKSYSRWFVADSWEPELLQDVKVTIVFYDEKIYNAYIELMKENEFNNDFSVAYFEVHGNEGKFIKEYKFRRKDGIVSPSYFDNLDSDKSRKTTLTAKDKKLLESIGLEFSVLTSEERKVILLSAGVLDGVPKANWEIAEEFEITEETVEELLKSGIDKIREQKKK